MPIEVNLDVIDMIFRTGKLKFSKTEDLWCVLNKFYKSTATMQLILRELTDPMLNAGIELYSVEKSKLAIEKKAEMLIRLIDMDGKEYNENIRTYVNKIVQSPELLNVNRGPASSIYLLSAGLG